MKKLLYISVFLVVVFISSDALMAQGAAPILPNNPDQAPIDGGLLFLAAAGGAYAVNKLRNREK